jgi:basic amino acid/polyamine antiporter, APA family
MTAAQNRTGSPRLERELGTFGAVMMGLGAMIGTGVFVSLGLGAGIAGPAVILALALAAGIALCNGLSSAQLAASHPVSGGTYEYGYVYLSSWAGFTAGWVFLIAKSASAATAALGFSGYLLHALGQRPTYLVPLALAVLAALTGIVLAGIRRSSLANIAIVSVTLLALVFFVAAGLPLVELDNLLPFFATEPAGNGFRPAALLEATALMFVAYTGYARIATLGEEVRDPRRTIPKAIILSAVFVMLLYGAVAIVAIGVGGGDGLLAATEEQAAPLAVVAQRFSIPGSSMVLATGALTAMLGVLLNLLLGLSRVVLAMARRGDLFAVLATLNKSGTTPYWAVLAVAIVIAALVTIGNVRTTWSFSAFSVLIYYALTNLAAWRMPAGRRLYPRWIAGVGFIACLVLAFWVERDVWLIGLGLIALGLAWHAIARERAAATHGRVDGAP